MIVAQGTTPSVWRYGCYVRGCPCGTVEKVYAKETLESLTAYNFAMGLTDWPSHVPAALVAMARVGTSGHSSAKRDSIDNVDRRSAASVYAVESTPAGRAKPCGVCA
mmetsp:Transcript_33672/g.88507  ORF Transcript_33672/g.88507 Transcript_33672/m.88507 type:complete len:107 (-) Transcript_33672:814-1134(-)